MTREEYRRWAEQQPKRRFERIDGVVVAMAPERASDADRKALVRLTLRQAVAAGQARGEIIVKQPRAGLLRDTARRFNPRAHCVSLPKIVFHQVGNYAARRQFASR